MDRGRDGNTGLSDKACSQQGDGAVYCGGAAECKQEEGDGGHKAGGHHAPCHGQADEGCTADDEGRIYESD